MDAFLFLFYYEKQKLILEQNFEVFYRHVVA